MPLENDGVRNRSRGKDTPTTNALRDSDEQYRLMFQSNPHPMWVHDLETNTFVAVNDAAAALYGYSPEEFSLLRVEELLPRGNVSGADDFAGVGKHRKKDGSLLDVEIVQREILFNGRPARLILASDVTERARVEQVLKEQETRDRAIINSVPDLLFRIDGDGFFHEFHAPDASRLYLPPEHFLHKNIRDVLPPHVANPAMEAVKRTLQTGDMETFEYELEMQGTIHYYEDRIVPLAGNHILSVIRDVTERRSAELALKESEWRNKIISDLITDYVLVVDIAPDGILHVRWNSENMEELTGEIPHADTLHGLWGQVVHPEDWNAFSAFVQQALSTRGAGEFECRVLLKNKQEHWVHIFVQPQANGSNGMQTVVAAVKDITAQKLMEIALSANEARYRIVADNTYDWEFWLDTKGNFAYTSPSCWRVSGYSAAEFTGDPGLFFRINHPDDLERVRRHTELVTNEKVFDEIEFRIMHPREGEKWIAHVCQPIFDDDGTYLGTRGSNRDITERKRVESLLQEWASFAQMNPSPVLRFDMEGRVTLANYAAFHAFDVSSFSDETVADFLPPLTLEKARSLILENSIFDFEIRLGQRDYKFVASGARAMESGYLYGVDITERKRAEGLTAHAREEAEAANRELKQALEREQLASHTDSLTEVFNRRHFFEFAVHEFAMARRYRRPLALVMLDIDHFKQVNDTWGHQVGDVTLKRVAQIAREHLRKTDILARYGGEEFTVLLPNSNAQEALVVAERIREDIASYRFDTGQGGQAGVTASIGVAQVTDNIASLDVLLQCADQAMYAAKEAGRNRVAVFTESP